MTYPGIDKLRSIKELNDVREYLLDLIAPQRKQSALIHVPG